MDELLGREEALSDRLLGGDEGCWLVGLLWLGCVVLQESRVMYVSLWWWLRDREKRGEKKEKGEQREGKGGQEREEKEGVERDITKSTPASNTHPHL